MSRCFGSLSCVGWSFLRYFAIAENRRSQAVGRRFWRLVGASLRDVDWPERVVFEVENPADVEAEAERVIRRRRMSFWTACGARLLAVPDYVLPDYTGSGLAEPMLLMAGGPSSGSTAGRRTGASAGSVHLHRPLRLVAGRSAGVAGARVDSDVINNSLAVGQNRA